jgi:acetyltransferase-like isoleucine patch superfamily enzyme
MIEIHPTAYVSPLADIEESVKGSKIVVGPNSYIDAFVKIKAAGGTGDIVIGSNSFINSGCVLYIGNGIVIGNNVSIAANCVLAPTNHEFENRNMLHQMQGFRPSRGGIRIEDDVWIGATSVLLDGATLVVGCVVGACSLVRGSTEPYGIYAGNPLVKRGERIVK